MSPRRFLNIFPRKFILKKIFNYILFKFSFLFKFKKIFYLPVTMDIEPTTGCNFRCTMCQVSSPDFKAENMKLELFKNLIDDNPQLIKIKLQGMGEPLVNKHIFEMIQYAYKYGIATEIISNGSMLDQNKIDLLLKYNHAKLTISIDGATDQTFEKIRVNSKFSKVLDNAKIFRNSIKRKLIRPEFSAWCTVQKSNLDEIEKIAGLCHNIGFDNLTYQIYLTGWGKEEWNLKNKEQTINYKNQSIVDRFESIKKKYKKTNFKVSVFEENLLSFEKKCSWPINSSYISSTGDVVPCCIIADPKVVSLGNIKENNFGKIWSSEKYNQFRKKIDNNNLEDYCKNCYKEFQ